MRLLEMNHIKKSFDGQEVLKDISIHVDEGEVLSIIGPPVPVSLPCCGARRCLRPLMTERLFILGIRRLSARTDMQCMPRRRI